MHFEGVSNRYTRKNCFLLMNLKGRAAGAIDQKVHRAVQDHKEPGQSVHLVEEEAGNVLDLVLDTSNDQTGVANLKA